MEHHLCIIQSRDFIHLTPEGKLDKQSSLGALAKILALNRDCDIVIDLRNAEIGIMSHIDLVDVVDYMQENLDTFANKIAMLTTSDQHHPNANFFREYGLRRGVRMQFFENYEEAMDWLAKSATVSGKNH